MVPVYGPDGTEYPSYEAAIAAGVATPLYVKPATAPRANIPTYGYELQRLMSQYGVNAPVAPRTTDQALINQYFSNLNTPMYEQPSGNALFNKYLDIGMGRIAAPSGPMTSFFPGQPVAPAGYRYDPVTASNVSLTAPGGVAEAGRITTGTPNIGGNQCPPGFTFDPTSRSCIPGPDTGLLTGGQSISAQQPMPTCPPGFVLDPVNRTCVPQQVAEYTPPVMQQPLTTVQPPPPTTQTPVTTPVDQRPATACPPGYEEDLNVPGRCVPGYNMIVNNIRQAYNPEGASGATINKDETRAIFEAAAGMGLSVPQLNEMVNTYAPGLKMTAGQIEDAIRWAAPDQAEAYLAQQPEYDKSIRYAKGGSVDMDNLVKKYQVGGLNRIPGFNEMVMGQQQPNTYTPPMFIEPGLREMMDRYDMRPEQMIRTGSMGRPAAAPSIDRPASQAGISPAMQRYDEAANRLRSTIETLGQERQSKGPSKAEMYFRLAAAFGAPTKTGSFFENLGLAGQELAAYKAEQRAAESSSAEQRRNLALELAKFDVDQAKELLGVERQALSAESAYGRQAADEGRVRGTPEFAARVQELAVQAANREDARFAAQGAREERLAGQAALAASRMTANEMRLRSEAEKEVTAGNIAISALNQAIELSEDAYTASIEDKAARAWAELTSPESPKVVATRVMEQLLTLTVLNNLKLMFGGNPTEGERAIALATAGVDAISISERNKNLAEALEMTTARRDAMQQRVDDILSREYISYDEGDENGE